MRTAMGAFLLCDMNGRRVHKGDSIAKDGHIYEVIAIEPDTDDVFITDGEARAVVKSWMVESFWEAV